MPWVPAAVLAELIEASRLLREQVATPRPVSGVAEAVEPPAPSPAAEAEPMPPAVVQAIEMYSYGDPAERAANYRRAVKLLADNVPAAQVIRTLRSGADMRELFV